MSSTFVFRGRSVGSVVAQCVHMHISGLFCCVFKEPSFAGEEHENMFSVQDDSKSLHAGEKISCVR